MDWPSLNPDLNPIENICWIIVSKIYGDGKQYDYIIQLKESIEQEWESIHKSTLKS